MWALLNIDQKSFSGAASLVVGELRSGAEILHCPFWGGNSKSSMFQVWHTSSSFTASSATCWAWRAVLGRWMAKEGQPGIPFSIQWARVAGRGWFPTGYLSSKDLLCLMLFSSCDLELWYLNKLGGKGAACSKQVGYTLQSWCDI